MGRSRLFRFSHRESQEYDGISLTEMAHKITALTSQKRNPQRINVYLDGEFAFGLSRIVAAWLQVGQELSDEKITKLQTEDEQELAYQQALKFLNFRQRSEMEIRKNLTEHRIPEETIEVTLGRLRSNGLVDDAQFAQNWIDNRSTFRPRSRKALAMELRQRGIDRETIEEALVGVDEEEAAYQAALKQAKKCRRLDQHQFRQKLYTHLARLGFDYSITKQVIDRIWTEQTESSTAVDYQP